MKVKTALVVTLAFVAFIASGCGLAQNLMGGGNSGTVSTLWSDVPPLPNATKANINIPLPVQFIVQGFMQAANAQNSNSDTKLDKFDFVVYQTADTPAQVADFYSADKMTAAGWNSQDTPGCSAGGGASGSTAGFCVFGKKDDSGKQTVLMIVPAADDASKQTQVFFVRFEGTTTKTQ